MEQSNPPTNVVSNDGLDVVLCGRCSKNAASEPHACPYAQEIGDKDGWLEDAGYFRAAYAAINDTALMLRGMTLDPRIPKDTKDALWARVRELEA